ncbi:DUF2809 domain-containing protein [Priestia aryabhattai]|uniref:ribosomal maturation YjgA family protein n=1 Tax=Priestia aryabhattai TaxID=412384 RepID=UPI0039A1C97E
MNKRNRWVYLLLAIIIMGAGLLSRKLTVYIPHIINIYIGDSLWALMIFVGAGFLFPKEKTKMIGMFAIVFCYFIEFTQLYHAPWIDDIRKTTLGGLILGYGFLWSDILAYSIGIAIGMSWEYYRYRFKKSA